MNRLVCYIGKDNQQLPNLSKQLGEQIEVFPSYGDVLVKKQVYKGREEIGRAHG